MTPRIASPAIDLSCPLLGLLLLPFLAASARATDSTWLAAAGTGDWSTAANWSGAIVPGANADYDTAIFGTANITAVSVGVTTRIGGIAFSSGANAFVLTQGAGTLTLGGAGINNQSGLTQTVVNLGVTAYPSGKLLFTNSASAGSKMVLYNHGGAAAAGQGGSTTFRSSATAGEASFINYAGTVAFSYAGETVFYGNATAGTATIANYGGAGNSGATRFYDDASADHASITNGAVAGNSSGLTQFEGRSTAGDATFLNQGGNAVSSSGGTIALIGTASGGRATFINEGGATESSGGASTSFARQSSAGSAKISNLGATAASSAQGGVTSFADSASAENATVTNGGSRYTTWAASGRTEFNDSATAGAATLIAEDGIDGGTGGRIRMMVDSTGGTARVQVSGHGNFDISGHNAPGVAIGSIAGSGVVTLGARTLTVGTNAADTAFSGVIQDEGSAVGTGGALTKIGAGTLSLSGASTFTGGTTLSAGTILALNRTGSALGSGPITVGNGAALGGNGIIAAPTTVTSGGRLTLGVPGGTLTFTQGLTLNAGAVLEVAPDTTTAALELTGGALTVPSADGAVTINLLEADSFSIGVAYPILKIASGSLTLADFAIGSVDGSVPAAYFKLSLDGSTLVLRRTSHSRLSNIATRAMCRTGDEVTIGGFVVAGSGTKRVLVRAVGPSLTAQGLTTAEVLTDPVIEVHDALHDNQQIAANDNWGDNDNAAQITATAASVGAATLLSSDTRSAALLLDLAPGIYSFVSKGQGGATGIVLLEIYDVDGTGASATLSNIATRAYATTGNGVTIGGFVIAGNEPKPVLLRAVGPTLVSQGLQTASVLAGPVIELHDATHNNEKIATNDDWGDNSNAAAIVVTGARIGATPFDATDKKSSALLVTLNPGVYSFIASGASTAPNGIVLVEVYDAD